MTTMQCPLGHPPGPQPFCPICGRATVPVPDVPSYPPSGQPAAAAPPASPPPPDAPDAGGTDAPAPDETASFSYEPTPPLASGPAAEDARRLIDELTGGTAAPSSTSWGAGPSIPSQESGVPSYAPQPPEASEPPPTPPPLPPAPPAPLPGALPTSMTASQPILPAEPAPRAAHGPDAGRGTAPEDDERRGSSSKLLPLLLALALLLGGGYLVKTLLLDDDEDTLATPPANRPSATAGTPSAAGTPAANRPAYTPAQIAAALQDPHFRHGYEAGKKKAAAGAVSDPEGTCRAMGLEERTTGYPWGAHDRQGCLVGITGG